MTTEFKINNFALLRIFAATEVLLYHSFSHLQLAFPVWFKILANFRGIPMFFVMSGFLVSASYERNYDLKNYFTNRFLRIYPALWVCILATVITISAIGAASFLRWDALIWLMSQMIGVIYTPGFLRDYGFGSYNGSLWTIPIELQFYILIPIVYFIIQFFSKRKNCQTALLATAFFVFFILSYYIQLHYTSYNLDTETRIEKLIRYSFIPNFYLFIFGVLLQRIKANDNALINGKGFIWVFIYLFYCLYIPAFPLYLLIKTLILGVTTISLAYTFPKVAHQILKGNDISYGVYIYHGLILGVLVQFKLTGNYYLPIAVLILTYFIAFLSWQLIEKPFLNKKKKSLIFQELPLEKKKSVA